MQTEDADIELRKHDNGRRKLACRRDFGEGPGNVIRDQRDDHFFEDDDDNFLQILDCVH